MYKDQENGKTLQNVVDPWQHICKVRKFAPSHTSVEPEGELAKHVICY